jgi:phosphoglycerol transferase MdoB-like AlkP superfamily enzyme
MLTRSSLVTTFVFWWMLLVVVQQAQRVFLLLGVLRREWPSPALATMTLATGLRADLVTAGFGMLAALAVAGLVGAVVALRRPSSARAALLRALRVTSAVVAVLYAAVLTVDMGYYQYSGQRLDAVFVEYLMDVVGQAGHGGIGSSQVGQQTAAEVGNVPTWAGRVAGFVAVEAAALAVWWLVFARWLAPWLAGGPRVAALVVPVCVAVGAWGVHPGGPDSVQAAPISSSTYYTLSQSPVWFLGSAMAQVSDTRSAVTPAILAAMPEERAVRIVRELIAPGARFVSERYPLVHAEAPRSARLARPPNVLLVFVEALDRRFLGRTVQGRRITPFLDRLLEDSVYVDSFVSNGANTFHGLFASLCSALPRQGTAATKARYANDYLCLPSLLARAGYHTRMVIGQNRDRSHSRLGLFMARNGLEALIDESGFPATAARMGLGMTDGALFDRIRVEIEGLRATGRPYFLATLTTGTHHPFVVPDTHPDVAALRAHGDRYIPALRYLDVELERFFTGLLRDGLLADTVVVLLGDHGRHERIARTEFENEAGHFSAPLAIWLDASLRTGTSYRPRVVPGVASQLDLTPTILGLAGLTPPLSPFVGRDIGCALAEDCLGDRPAYLAEVYDQGGGLADRDGFWFYGFNRRTVEHADLALRQPSRVWAADDPAVAARVERILALYVMANALVERNAIWSWGEFGALTTGTAARPAAAPPRR